MPAAIDICESNTGGETVSHDVANINFGSNDSTEIVIATYPINRGDYSYEKWLRYHVSNLSGSNQIDNLQVWLTGSADTGIVHLTNLSGTVQDDAYATPIATVSTLATIAMPITDPGAANIGKSGSTATPLDTTGQYSDYIVTQVETQGSAAPGDQTSRNWYFQYDEQ